MNATHEANLRKMVNYLKSGKLKARFNMNFYADEYHMHIEDWEPWKDDTCGSVGCVIGHGPYARIKRQRYEDWGSYCERVFGIQCDSTKYRFVAWDWLFSSSWASIDNSTEGAALRIEYYLRNRRPPKFLQKADHLKDIEEEYWKWRKSYLTRLQTKGVW